MQQQMEGEKFEVILKCNVEQAEQIRKKKLLFFCAKADTRHAKQDDFRRPLLQKELCPSQVVPLSIGHQPKGFQATSGRLLEIQGVLLQGFAQKKKQYCGFVYIIFIRTYLESVPSVVVGDIYVCSFITREACSYCSDISHYKIKCESWFVNYQLPHMSLANPFL